MKEIRIRWRPNVVHRDDEPGDVSLWQPYTPQALRELQLIVDAANEVHGEATHWVEERESHPGAE